MDAYTAQYRAVIATAQLASARPELDVDVQVVRGGPTSAWQALVRWVDGPSVEEVQRITDGPPPGVLLFRDVSIPELDHDRDA